MEVNSNELTQFFSDNGWKKSDFENSEWTSYGEHHYLGSHKSKQGFCVGAIDNRNGVYNQVPICKGVMILPGCKVLLGDFNEHGYINIYKPRVFISEELFKVCDCE